MRKITTLTLENYENTKENGVKMVAPQIVFDQLKEHLVMENLLPDEYFLLCNELFQGKRELPDVERTECRVGFGGNEGIYLDIYMIYTDSNGNQKRFSFATGKTLKETGDAYLKMYRIAAECDLMLNGGGSVITFEEDEGIS